MKTGKNLFRGRGNNPSRLFYSHVGGTAALYDRRHGVLRAQRELLSPAGAGCQMRPPTPTGASTTAPRRCACRNSDPQNTRIENRVPGADANPYLCIAASLACGYLGMMEKLKPSAPIEGSAYSYAHSLPINLDDAMNKLNYSGH